MSQKIYTPVPGGGIGLVLTVVGARKGLFSHFRSLPEPETRSYPGAQTLSMNLTFPASLHPTASAEATTRKALKSEDRIRNPSSMQRVDELTNHELVDAPALVVTGCGGLRGLTLLRIGSRSSRSTLTSKPELVDALRQLFGFDVDTIGDEALDALWVRVHRAHLDWEAAGRP